LLQGITSGGLFSESILLRASEGYCLSLALGSVRRNEEFRDYANIARFDIEEHHRIEAAVSLQRSLSSRGFPGGWKPRPAKF